MNDSITRADGSQISIRKKKRPLWRVLLGLR